LHAIPRGSLVDGALPSAADLLVATGLSKSKGEARRTVAEGGISVNNNKVEDADAAIDENLLIHKRFLVIRRGKKNFGGVEVVA